MIPDWKRLSRAKRRLPIFMANKTDCQKELESVKRKIDNIANMVENYTGD